MDRILTLAIAGIGALAGLLLATGRFADVVVPLLAVLAVAAACRLRLLGGRLGA